MNRMSEIQELSAADMDEVSGGSYALVKAFLDGAQAAMDKLPTSGGNGRSDLGQKLQLQLTEANNVHQ